MSKIVKYVASVSSAAYMFIVAGAAYAQTTSNPGVVINTTLSMWITSIFKWVAVLSGIIFVGLFLVGGIQYLTSAGNEEASGKAKKLLVDAVVGLIIVLVAYAAGNYILQLVGLGDIQSLSNTKSV